MRYKIRTSHTPEWHEQYWYTYDNYWGERVGPAYTLEFLAEEYAKEKNDKFLEDCEKDRWLTQTIYFSYSHHFTINVEKYPYVIRYMDKTPTAEEVDNLQERRAKIIFDITSTLIKTSDAQDKLKVYNDLVDVENENRKKLKLRAIKCIETKTEYIEAWRELCKWVDVYYVRRGSHYKI